MVPELRRTTVVTGGSFGRRRGVLPVCRTTQPAKRISSELLLKIVAPECRRVVTRQVWCFERALLTKERKREKKIQEKESFEEKKGGSVLLKGALCKILSR